MRNQVTQQGLVMAEEEEWAAVWVPRPRDQMQECTGTWPPPEELLFYTQIGETAIAVVTFSRKFRRSFKFRRNVELSHPPYIPKHIRCVYRAKWRVFSDGARRSSTKSHSDIWLHLLQIKVFPLVFIESLNIASAIVYYVKRLSRDRYCTWEDLFINPSPLEGPLSHFLLGPLPLSVAERGM